jgi:YgiT-type zinc finger domain-containing protein
VDRFSDQEGRKGRSEMKETMIDAQVTYTLEHGGRFFIVENVPARVRRETGEQYFAPETIEHIQAITKSKKRPDRVIETPVYEYA